MALRQSSLWEQVYTLQRLHLVQLRPSSLFHDGRTLVSDTKVSVGDTCVVETPGTKILDVIPLQKGVQVIITSGVNAGRMGKLIELKPGTFILPKRADVDLGERQIEIPADLVMAVGKDKPVIQIQ